MLIVKTPQQVLPILFGAVPSAPRSETVPLSQAAGRVLFSQVVPREFVPPFDRSTVDGYAVSSRDTFGCSDSLPALLTLQGEILMGQSAPAPLKPGCCMAIPTGGALPEGADAVVMVEHTESFGGGLIGVSRPASPAENVVFKGDDLSPLRPALPAGHRLRAQDLGVLAALGYSRVTLCKRPTVAILSTGDELVPPETTPDPGQVRDINSSVLASLCEQWSAPPEHFGIIPDDEALLGAAIDRAVERCDLVLISGGSSVGAKDAVCRLLESHGQVHFHGVAMKPGKPTMFATVKGTPVFGLPGHPAAAFLAAHLFVRPLLAHMTGCTLSPVTLTATLTEAVSANHGRAQYTAVSLRREEGVLYAHPIRGGSGLISTLSRSQGYFCIDRDCEGLPKGARITVTLYSTD